MKTIEIYAGTKSFSKVADGLGHDTLTIDNDPRLGPDICMDVLGLTSLPKIDLLWASPPCQGFSVAAIGHNWTGGNGAYIPKSESARLSIALAKKTIEIIKTSKPTWWFIENPRGLLRKMPFMQEFLAEMGGGTAHHLILSVWRYAHEADGYLDKCEVVDASPYMQEWRSVPRGRAERIKDRHAGDQRRKGQGRDTRRAFQRDIRPTSA